MEHTILKWLASKRKIAPIVDYVQIANGKVLEMDVINTKRKQQMNILKKQLEATRKAHAHASQASEAWGEYLLLSKEIGEDRVKTAEEALLAFIRISSSTERELEGILAERNRMFESTTILQAVIRWNGLERKIVVAKPNFRIDEPFIPEGFYRAIRNKWQVPESEEIVTTERYNIIVVDKYLHKITTIQTLTCKI